MIIKVCGMRDAKNIQEIAELGIDWMGFIFYPKSPRYFLQNKDNHHQLSLVDSQLSKVGVFVNEDEQQMKEIAEKYNLDYLQLHGSETPEQCKALKGQGYKIIKVFSVAAIEDLERVTEYEEYADYFLFDTKCEQYGGSGRIFDWSVLNAYTGTIPFLLSGGINPASLEAISSFTHPALAGIDLNSGFEVSPACKDPVLLGEFIKRIKEIKTDKL